MTGRSKLGSRRGSGENNWSNREAGIVFVIGRWYAKVVARLFQDSKQGRIVKSVEHVLHNHSLVSEYHLASNQWGLLCIIHLPMKAQVSHALNNTFLSSLHVGWHRGWWHVSKGSGHKQGRYERTRLGRKVCMLGRWEEVRHGRR